MKKPNIQTEGEKLINIYNCKSESGINTTIQTSIVAEIIMSTVKLWLNFDCKH